MSLEAGRDAWSRRHAMLAGLATSIVLAGCATPPRNALPGEAFWSGRLALNVESDPPQSYSASFDLRGSPAAGELLLNSPLGNTLARVLWRPGSAELHQGDRVTQRQSLDELTTEFGGTALPVAALFAWLQGQAREADGWQADLSRQPEGRVNARRRLPLPAAELRLIFEP